MLGHIFVPFQPMPELLVLFGEVLGGRLDALGNDFDDASGVDPDGHAGPEIGFARVLQELLPVVLGRPHPFGQIFSCLQRFSF